MNDENEIDACCGDCRFWKARSLDDDMGRCRRYAPRPVSLDVEAAFAREACFPLTADFDWCGEFEIRKYDSDE